MATLPLQPACAPANPSRRALMAGIGTLSALGTIPAFAYARPIANSAAWDRLAAQERAAAHARDEYYRLIWKPLYDQLDRAAPHPGLCFDVPARDGKTARFHLHVDDLHCYDNSPSLIFRQKAAEQREAWLRHRRVSKELGFDDADDEYDRLSDAYCDAVSALLGAPAPHLAALLWKLEHLFGADDSRDTGGEGASYCKEWMDALMADARRLLSGGTH